MELEFRLVSWKVNFKFVIKFKVALFLSFRKNTKKRNAFLCKLKKKKLKRGRFIVKNL